MIFFRWIKIFQRFYFYFKNWPTFALCSNDLFHNFFTVIIRIVNACLVLTANIIALTALDFLGYGLPPDAASLGELLLQGKNNLEAPWLVLSGFFTLAIVLSMLIYIGEAARDAFDPRR